MALLERLGVPPSAREPVHVDALTQSWRRVMEEQIVQHFNVAELAAVARFYNTPEAQSLLRKMVAFTTLVAPMLEAEVYPWARRLTSAETPTAGCRAAPDPIASMATGSATGG